METAGRHQEVMILKGNYHIDGHAITLEIANEALESAFEKVKADALQSIRDGLKNDTITLKSAQVTVDKEKMLYTDQEKFEHMKKKYPALRDLQEQLGLDPEF
jgi:DNA polymerase-3 subunit gamma/tau